MIVLGLSIVAAGILIATVCLLLLGWGGLLGRAQRLGLALFAAGMVLAAIPRFSGHPPSWGDLIMLAGLAVFLWSTYGPKILRHADGLDGKIDSRIHVGAIDIDATAITRALTVDRRRRRGF
ncbi:hypothetical protein CA606_18285 [Caulobacter vibrioides]|uniref:Uncharacterized protein n=1 Tax=Caulobacter vibrioides TaxID=155892 RepID=A0A290N335_CAUVI|nr:hypothetical protein [Caulobacter vibrioides]ATC34123.1 hypothetical protein CA606_18285 [Caulobacter vibrioides]